MTCQKNHCDKAVKFDAVKKNCEMKVITDLQPLHRQKIWDPFRSGEHERDLYAESLVPMATWSRTTSLKVSVNYILNIYNNCIYTLFTVVINR